MSPCWLEAFGHHQWVPGTIYTNGQHRIALSCIPVLYPFQEVGVDQMIIHMQIGNVPHQRIMDTVEIVASELPITEQSLR